MSNARKLQTEIDRVMKKVDEGTALFDEIWEKVYSAEQQNQKEKYEMDLKKEIKKLQRLRDQIKTWIGNSDIKDKDNLVEARKLIETKMEQFKICEKETKTKTYSKEGLLREERLDPAEAAKQNTVEWIGDYIEKLNQLIQDREVEIERLQSGKGKKTNKNIIEEYMQFVLNHKFHINKLEGIMRLVNNDVLDVEIVDPLKDDLDYYLDSYEDDDYIQAYDEDYFYDALGLDELDVVNVDRVTQIPSSGKDKKNSDDVSATSSVSKTGKSKSAGVSVGIPLTIGRARVSSTGEKEKAPVSVTPAKAARAVTTGSQPTPSLGPTPAARPPPTVNTGGASMAAILKREGEQQERERQQKALQQQQLLQEQQAREQAEQARQQQLQLQQQQEAQLRQQEVLRQQQAQQEALKRQEQQQLQEQQARIQQAAQQEAAVQQQQQLQAQQAVLQKAVQELQQLSIQSQSSSGQEGTLDMLGLGLGSLSLGTGELPVDSRAPLRSSAVSPQPQPPAAGSSYDALSSNLSALNESFAYMPTNADSDRDRQYTPRNPYPTPASFPSTPSPIFDHPVIFEKLGTDALFFIFYYAQGTYQQYLAARELKKQSWRYHKKYMTWFQRHEEPKVTTDEYEQGTYVYFDYETGWCQRIKSDFRFEYSFLEDSLA